MHIPDGFLDAKTWTTTTVAGAAALAYTLHKTKLTVSRKKVPMIALVGSFIFAAQMINFPIAGATSGHFLGGALAAILFGPLIGSIVMSAVLIIQAFVFQDGGITVLGANLLCSAFIGCFVGYGIYRSGNALLRGRGQPLITFLAGWCSIVVAAAAVAVLIALSGTAPLQVVLLAMLGWHSLIGIGEGLITMFVIAYLGSNQEYLDEGVSL